MDKIKVNHDAVGHTLTVWFDDPSKEGPRVLQSDIASARESTLLGAPALIPRVRGAFDVPQLKNIRAYPQDRLRRGLACVTAA